jgi:hypothetical protein
MLLYFEPSMNSNEWPLVIEALKILHPRLRWQSGVSLDSFSPFEIPGILSGDEADPINGLLLPVTNTGGLNYGRFKNHKEFIDTANKYGIGYFGDSVKDGREYLGLNEDTNSIFNSLDETIRKVIKSYL